MSKPDWKDAPEWAQWLAQDENGKWFWYEREPSKDQAQWSAPLGGRYEACVKEWDETKEPRP